MPIEDHYGMEIGSKDIGIKVNESKKPVWKNLVRSYHLLGGGKEEKIIFRGKGKGSGLGLSAWGARGMLTPMPRLPIKRFWHTIIPELSLSVSRKLCVL